MRRDICYFFPTNVENLYGAYLLAAKNPPFGRSCKEEPFHTFSFGLNFSMKYNMNGGSCTIRFIRCTGGSAVNFRFTVAQLGGARYEKYAADLTKYAESILRIPGQLSSINVEEFVKSENKVYPSNYPTQHSYQTATQTVSQPTFTQSSDFCPECHCRVIKDASFCNNCGAKLKKLPITCPNCGTLTPDGAKFCQNCGTKL